MAHLHSDEGVATLKRYGDRWASVSVVYSSIHSFIDPLSKTCQSVDPQNPCKETAADEGEISNINEVQNPYKLPLNPELTVFIEKPDKSANDVIGYYYQYRFEDNNR
jgi:adenylylsulfate kinase-like enzyme